MKIRDLLKYVEPDHRANLTVFEPSWSQDSVRFRLSCSCGWTSAYVMTMREYEAAMGRPGIPKTVLNWEENEIIDHLLDQEIDDLVVLEALK